MTVKQMKKIAETLEMTVLELNDFLTKMERLTPNELVMMSEQFLNRAHMKLEDIEKEGYRNEKCYQ